MSQAGKFIPGGAGRKTDGIPTNTDAIRVPSGSGPGGDPSNKRKNRLLQKGAALARKPVSKQQRMPIVIMSSIVCCLLVSFAWYELGILPARRLAEAAHQREVAAQQQLAATLAAEKEREQLAEAQRAHVPITVNSQPAAFVTIGNSPRQPTPATFENVPPGKVTVLIQVDGYEEYRKELTAVAGQPIDLGTIHLVQQTGSLSLSSPQQDVDFTLTGPGGYSQKGNLPVVLDNLAVGNYQATVHHADWTLPPVAVTIGDKQHVQKEIKFPYGSVAITTGPPGATVRNGNKVLGKTPVTLSGLRPGPINLSVDLPPYTVQRLSLDVPEGGTIIRQIILKQNRDFISACGMPMVWIPEGYWVGKYDVTQREFESLTNFNPSAFSGPDRPVEKVTWEAAAAFCNKLNQEEQKADKLPAGFHYTLPTESQWETFSADADINLAAMSRSATLSSTQDVGASEPNKYGLYDTLGNVWEWCLDAFDTNGAHSLRGGSWLSSIENFPTAATRSAGAAKYADRFTGFRVVLVPDK